MALNLIEFCTFGTPSEMNEELESVLHSESPPIQLVYFSLAD